MQVFFSTKKLDERIIFLIKYQTELGLYLTKSINKITQWMQHL